MRENEQLKEYPLAAVEHLKVHGRTTANRSPLTLFWTGSAVELNVRASELWVELEADYEQYEPWIHLVINGAAVSRQMITAGRRWVCVFRGMNADKVKNVRLVQEVQAMSGDPACLLQIHGLKLDGEVLPITERPYKIEFIGDSITSGEGAVGAQAEEDWIPMWFSAVHNYTYQTAEALNADYRVLSQSGWGVLSSWDNNPHGNLPQHYGQVCGLLGGAKQVALGSQEPADFAAWQPDVVVVNLGTNDGGAFHNPAWQDPVTGETFKQRLLEDGSYHEEDLQTLGEAIERFLVQLRGYNPQAHIVWAYGMLGIPMLPTIQKTVAAYAIRNADTRVSVLQLPEMTAETVGARWHPGIACHEQTARVLSDYLKGILTEWP